MVNVCHHKPTGVMLTEPALALFQQQWQLYRKFVDNNYFYHREVYDQLHRILVNGDLRVFPRITNGKVYVPIGGEFEDGTMGAST
jgi:hypothetical protein